MCSEGDFRDGQHSSDQTPSGENLIRFYHLVIMGLVSFLLGGSIVFIVIIHCQPMTTDSKARPRDAAVTADLSCRPALNIGVTSNGSPYEKCIGGVTATVSPYEKCAPLSPSGTLYENSDIVMAYNSSRKLNIDKRHPVTLIDVKQYIHRPMS